MKKIIFLTLMLVPAARNLNAGILDRIFGPGDAYHRPGIVPSVISGTEDLIHDVTHPGYRYYEPYYREPSYEVVEKVQPYYEDTNIVPFEGGSEYEHPRRYYYEQRFGDGYKGFRVRR